MIPRNLRHLRLFLAVAELGALTRAAARCNVSQPAVTQALSKLEQAAGGALFTRSAQGVHATPRGQALAARVGRALARLDPALAEISPRLARTATTAQLNALAAVCDAENFTLAARRLGLAQPTVHRAVTQLEHEAGRPLFERSAYGLAPTRACLGLAEAVRLAAAELTQAESEMAEFDGREAGRIVIGALPLSRSVLLPEALARFRESRPLMPVQLIDGPYGDLLAGLRRGDIDVIAGALRRPAPIGDVVQETLFTDHLAVVARVGHPLTRARGLGPAALAGHSWVVPRTGTPARARFDTFFTDAGLAPPASVIEAGSILFMREILARGDFLGCISAQQAGAEISKGLLARLDVDAAWPGREIGLTMRAGWLPTPAQRQMLELLRAAAGPVPRHVQPRGDKPRPMLQ